MYRWIMLLLVLLIFFNLYEFPAYSITANDDTLFIKGSFDVGMSREVADLLRSRNIKRVVLNSPGGLLVEGEAVAKMIDRLDLDTMVEDSCASACTVAFSAGKNRILKQGGQLGFHGASFNGVWVEPTSTVVGYLYRIGASIPFIREAYFATPPEEMWVPDPSVLANNRIITHFVTSNGRVINV
jgi:hypothetical protein